MPTSSARTLGDIHFIETCVHPMGVTDDDIKTMDNTMLFNRLAANTVFENTKENRATVARHRRRLKGRSYTGKNTRVNREYKEACATNIDHLSAQLVDQKANYNGMVLVATQAQMRVEALEAENHRLRDEIAALKSAGVHPSCNGVEILEGIE